MATNSKNSSFWDQRKNDLLDPAKGFISDVKNARSIPEKVLFGVTGLTGAAINTPLSLVTAPLSRLSYKLGTKLGELIPPSDGVVNVAENFNTIADKTFNSRAGKIGMALMSFIPETGAATNTFRTFAKVAKNPGLAAKYAKSTVKAVKKGEKYALEFGDNPDGYIANAKNAVNNTVVNAKQNLVSSAKGIAKDLKITAQEVKNAIGDGNFPSFVFNKGKDVGDKYLKHQYNDLTQKRYLVSDQDIINGIVTQGSNHLNYDNTSQIKPFVEASWVDPNPEKIPEQLFRQSFLVNADPYADLNAEDQNMENDDTSSDASVDSDTSPLVFHIPVISSNRFQNPFGLSLTVPNSVTLGQFSQNSDTEHQNMQQPVSIGSISPSIESYFGTGENSVLQRLLNSYKFNPATSQQ